MLIRAKRAGMIALISGLAACSVHPAEREFKFPTITLPPPVTPAQVEATVQNLSDHLNNDRRECIGTYDPAYLAEFERSRKYPMSGQITDQNKLNVIKCMEARGWQLTGPAL